ncbi:MAG: hypothetical protein K2L96_08535 [Muribaculaceae bacterium]|nr:hypothetical protein [Muribaculaceae bacterium]
MKINPIYKYAVLCILVTALSGCIQFRVNKVPEDSFEFDFLRALENQNGTIFESEDGKQDLMLSSKITVSDLISASEAYDMFEKLGSFANCELIIIHDSETIKGRIRLITEPNDSNIYFRSRLGAQCYFIDSNLNKYTHNLELDGVKYPNCLIVDSVVDPINTEWHPLLDYHGYNDSICEYALSPEVGLLYYTMKDGSRYVRKEGTPTGWYYPRPYASNLEMTYYCVRYSIYTAFSWLFSRREDQ